MTVTAVVMLTATTNETIAVTWPTAGQTTAAQIAQTIMKNGLYNGATGRFYPPSSIIYFTIA